MKQIISSIAIVFLFASCKSDKKNIVSVDFIDSLIKNYTQPAEYGANQTDLEFWRNRIDPNNPGLTNELKYAGALVQRFHLSGDINDLVTADSILSIVDLTYAHKETAPGMMLFRNSILQHRFTTADSILEKAKEIGIRQYESLTASFDIDFELGRYMLAESQLKKIDGKNDYGYNFRKAKLAHYKGTPDSAIAAMSRAAELAGTNVSLQQAAISNQADLNLHTGNLQEAYDLYKRSVKLSATDLHSIMGIGWIALVHEKNDSLAEKIYRFVLSKTKAPDAIYKLVQVADARGDSTMQKELADQFAAIVTAPVYGNMYNKYLIELYTGILNEPAKADALAKKELLNRATAQTYAWYTWALWNNNKKAEAEKIYQQYVSGKPLEGLELYWMGRYMQGLGKGYNAKQFYKAANKNRYDLSPSMMRQLDEVAGD